MLPEFIKKNSSTAVYLLILPKIFRIPTCIEYLEETPYLMHEIQDLSQDL